MTALYVVPGVFLVLLAASVARIEWTLWRSIDSGAAFVELCWLFLAYFVAGLATCPAFVASLVHSFVLATTAERKKQVQVLSQPVADNLLGWHHPGTTCSADTIPASGDTSPRSRTRAILPGRQ